MIKDIDNEKDAKACDELLKLLRDSDYVYNDRIDLSKDIKPSFVDNLKNKDNKLLLGYFVRNKLVGFAYTTYFKQTQIAFIHYLYVLEEYRNQGIARALLQEIVARCQKQKVKDLSINTYANNKIAHHLYNKLGFNDLEITLVKKI